MPPKQPNRQPPDSKPREPAPPTFNPGEILTREFFASPHPVRRRSAASRLRRPFAVTAYAAALMSVGTVQLLEAVASGVLARGVGAGDLSVIQAAAAIVIGVGLFVGRVWGWLLILVPLLASFSWFVGAGVYVWAVPRAARHVGGTAGEFGMAALLLVVVAMPLQTPRVAAWFGLNRVPWWLVAAVWVAALALSAAGVALWV